MTVRELIDKLSELDQGMEAVFISVQSGYNTETSADELCIEIDNDLISGQRYALIVG